MPGLIQAAAANVLSLDQKEGDVANERTSEHIPVTQLILGLNSLLDSGKYDDITIDEIESRIDDGTVLEWLQERVGTDATIASHFRGPEREWYLGGLQAIHDAYSGDEGRKWGVRRKGLALLLAWTNELLQLGSGWRPWLDYARR